jgi:hypothetical protein
VQRLRAAVAALRDATHCHAAGGALLPGDAVDGRTTAAGRLRLVLSVASNSSALFPPPTLKCGSAPPVRTGGLSAAGRAEPPPLAGEAVCGR